MAVGNYLQELPNFGDLMTVEEFKRRVESKFFIDYDGFGQAVKEGKVDPVLIYPSQVDEIPEDATHIMWYNK